MKTKMKNNIILNTIIVSFITINLLFSCNSFRKKVVLKDKTIIKDTIFIDESTLDLDDVERRIFNKGKMITSFIKGDTIHLYCRYKNEYEEVVRESNLFYWTKDKSIKIQKKNNSNFYIFIPQSYKEKEFDLYSFISPNSNVLIKSIYEKNIIDSSGFTQVSLSICNIK